MFKIIEIIRFALIALRSNKVRAFLTMLGVIIGVFSVITLISLGRGIQNYVSDEFNALGSNLLFIAPGKAGVAQDPATSLTANKLSDKHIKLIETYAGEYLKAVSPYVIVGDTVSYKNKSFFGEVTGVSAQSIEIVNYQIAKGRVFTALEEKNSSRVAILGPNIVEEIFPVGSDPLGKKIKVGEDVYEVIGTFESKGANYDDQLIVPYTAAVATFNVKNYSSIFTEIISADAIDIASKKIEIALLRDLKEDEFSIMSQSDILETINSTLRVLTAGLGLIAGISLIVGGIGIMNIMLVSVKERTREIGLRKALGATSSNIALQFLFESIMISFLGGVIGIAFGYLATFIARYYIRAEIPMYALFLGFGFSSIVGVLFGTYPAIRASKLDPIEALRYE